MNLNHAAKLAVASAFAILLAGCVSEPLPPTDGTDSVTWQEAKAEAQAMELEIANQIPADLIANIDQHGTGNLFRCGGTEHLWSGMTSVALIPDTSIESVVQTIEKHFREDGQFEIATRRNIADRYEVQLMSTTTAEGYIFGEGEPGTIRIESWSVCFTLPDGLYPGGDF